MAEFTLPANSKVRKDGRVFKAPAGAKNVRVFKIYRYDPDSTENPRLDSYEIDMDSCGPMVLDALIKIKNEIDSTFELSPLLPGGHLRLVRHEYRRQERARLHQRLRRRQERRQDLSAAASAGDQGPGARPHQFLCAVRLDQALAANAHARRPRTASGCSRRRIRRRSTGPRLAFCAPAARPAVRATGGTASGTWVRRPCWRPTGGSSTAATRRAASGSISLEDPFRLYRCHTIMNCTEACPKDLNPAKAISEIKQLLAHAGTEDGRNRTAGARQAALALPPRHEGARCVADALRRGAVTATLRRRIRRPSGSCWMRRIR